MPAITNFDPKKDVPDLSGKVILVTGGTAGVGAETLVELAQHNPSHLIFTGRNPKSAESTTTRATSTSPNVRISFVPCDLSDLSSVQAAAHQILTLTPSRLDAILCVAGVMAKPPALSKDGYEIQFATNHLGHALLTLKLLPLVERTPASRIIMVSSTGWRGAPPGVGIDFAKLRTTQEMAVMGRWVRYGQSKLANVLWARELAVRYPGVLSFSITPGIVETGLVTDLRLADRWFVYVTTVGRMQTVREGTYNLLWAVGVPGEEVEKKGGFYEPVGRLSTMETKASRDATLAGRLWEWTEEQLRPYL